MKSSPINNVFINLYPTMPDEERLPDDSPDTENKSSIAASMQKFTEHLSDAFQLYCRENKIHSFEKIYFSEKIGSVIAVRNDGKTHQESYIPLLERFDPIALLYPIDEQTNLVLEIILTNLERIFFGRDCCDFKTLYFYSVIENMHLFEVNGFELYGDRFEKNFSRMIVKGLNYISQHMEKAITRCIFIADDSERIIVVQSFLESHVILQYHLSMEFSPKQIMEYFFQNLAEKFPEEAALLKKFILKNMSSRKDELSMLLGSVQKELPYERDEVKKSCTGNGIQSDIVTIKFEKEFVDRINQTLEMYCISFESDYYKNFEYVEGDTTVIYLNADENKKIPIFSYDREDLQSASKQDYEERFFQRLHVKFSTSEVIEFNNIYEQIKMSVTEEIETSEEARKLRMSFYKNCEDFVKFLNELYNKSYTQNDKSEKFIIRYKEGKSIEIFIEEGSVIEEYISPISRDELTINFIEGIGKYLHLEHIEDFQLKLVNLVRNL